MGRGGGGEVKESWCTKRLTREFEHARTFARWDAIMIIFALTRLAYLGLGACLMVWGRLWTSLPRWRFSSETMNLFRRSGVGWSGSTR